MAPRYIRIDPREVIHETVDGEVILIALQTGCYYSLDGSGAHVWDRLAAGHSSSEVVTELEGRYSAEPGAIETAVTKLVDRLVDERLVRPVETNGTPVPTAESNGTAHPERSPFEQPALQKFTDMQDFLLVDPIHEVGDAGWPHSPATG
jgi:hypothetical protein